MSELLNLETLNAVEIFSKPDAMKSVIAQVQAEIDKFKGDVSTPKGRAEIKAFAYKITRSKTAIDSAGKDLNADANAKIKLVNSERKRVEGILIEMQTKVRQPLTDWEEADKKRVDDLETDLAILESFAKFDFETAKNLEQRIIDLQDHFGKTEWQECEDTAKAAFDVAEQKLCAALAAKLKNDADAAELAKLREESEKMKAEIAEAKEVKRKADEAKAEEEKKAEIEKQRQADEKDETERKERENANAERARKAAAEAAKEKEAQRVKDEAEAATRREEEEEAAEKKRVEDEKIAEEQKETDRLAAIEQGKADERKRQEDLKIAKDLEIEKREKNKRHVSKVHQEMVEAFVKLGMDSDHALDVIEAIAAGRIPHVSIQY